MRWCLFFCDLKFSETRHVICWLQEDLILEILGLAHQYGFVDLEAAISDFLKQALTVENCCLIYDSARLFNLKFLVQVSAAFIDEHVLQIIKHDTFVQLSMVNAAYELCHIGALKM